MQNTLKCIKDIASSFLLSVLLSSCHQNKVEEIIFEEKIPINIDLMSRIQTKVTDNNFDTNDEIGLYVLKSSSSLVEERHVDNMRFKYSANSWTPDDIIYYPSMTEPCDFIAYYPYQSPALISGTSSLVFLVKSDQSNLNEYSKNDLLVAERTSITPSTDPVQLVFKHKLAEIYIEIEPGNEFDSVDELAAANPTILIKDVATQTTYDFADRKFSNETEISNIVPTGEFSIASNKLVGKHAIIVPQEISGNKLFIEAKIKGKSYSFSFGENYKIAPSTKVTCTLTIKRASTQADIDTEITDWENSSSINGDFKEIEEEGNDPTPSNAYNVALPDFSESSVYKVMDGDTQIAEICREYLKNNLIDNQAIVVYPVRNNETDFKNGYATRILDGNAGNPIAGSKHGGAVSWDITNNTLTYTAGTSPYTNTVYIDEQGIIYNTYIANSKSTSVIPDIIEDSRDMKHYPVVKVASQYWMGSNLEAQTSITGTSIKAITKDADWKTNAALATPKAAYSINNSNYYYTFAALTDIAPQGWSVPTLNEWIKLRTYVNDNISVITDESWDEGINLTSLSIKAFGYRNTSGEYPAFTTKTIYFWHTDGGIKIVSGIVTDTSKKQGNSIRCIRN